MINFNVFMCTDRPHKLPEDLLDGITSLILCYSYIDLLLFTFADYPIYIIDNLIVLLLRQLKVNISRIC